MAKFDIELMKRLVGAFGISGSEEEVRDLIRKEIKPYVDEVYVDRIGNLIAVKRGDKPRVMLSAHMDEVGLLVKRISENGFMHCTAVGDVDAALMIGQTVHIKTSKGSLHGVITCEVTSAGKVLKSLPSIEDVVVDTGLSKKRLEEFGIEIGTPLPLEHNSCCTSENGLIFGKALDNRVGCYVLIELARRLKKGKVKGMPEIYFVFTVQEEVGSRGAKPSAFNILPDWGLIIDATYANDSFAEPSRFIGKGPAVTIKDGEFIGNKCINGWLRDIARKSKIPVQLEAIEFGTTDASMIQTTAGGIPTSVLCIPVRNIHTTISIAAIEDIENTILLLEEVMRKPPVVCLV